MTESWQCEVCGQHFTSTENWIELARKVRNGRSFEYVPYQDNCADCKLYDKKMAEKRLRKCDTRDLSKT
jgi:rubredoxin